MYPITLLSAFTDFQSERVSAFCLPAPICSLGLIEDKAEGLEAAE
jgi:hypothetical protein